MVGVIELASYITVDLNICDIAGLYSKTIGLIYCLSIGNKQLSFKRHFNHVLNLDLK